MKKILAGLFYVSLVLPTIGVLAADDSELCRNKYQKNVPVSVLRDRWPHYRFASEGAAEDDLKRTLRREGIVGPIDFWPWEDAHSGPAENYSGTAQHRSGKDIKHKDGSSERGPSMLMVEACEDTTSGARLVTLWGWK